MTLPNARRLLLMWEPSALRSVASPDPVLIFSLPAKSIKF